MDEDDCSSKALSVGTVRTVGRAGFIDTRSWVLCPRFGASVALSRCLSCSHREALRVTPQGAEVLCHPDLEATASESGAPLQLARSRVSDLMFRHVDCIAEDVGVEEAVHLLRSHEIQSVPVLNGEGRVVGVVSESDIQRYVQTSGGTDSASIDQTGLDPVSQAMVRSFLVIAESALVTRAAAVMAHEGVSQLLVSSSHGEMVGVLDAAAILRWLAQADGFLLGCHDARESEASSRGVRGSGTVPAVRLRADRSGEPKK